MVYPFFETFSPYYSLDFQVFFFSILESSSVLSVKVFRCGIKHQNKGEDQIWRINQSCHQFLAHSHLVAPKKTSKNWNQSCGHVRSIDKARVGKPSRVMCFAVVVFGNHAGSIISTQHLECNKKEWQLKKEFAGNNCGEPNVIGRIASHQIISKEITVPSYHVS